MTGTSFHDPETGPAFGAVRTGGLRLRGRTGPVPARVYWPTRNDRPPPPASIVVFDDAERVDADTDALWRTVCTKIGAVVVATIGLPLIDDAPSIMGWTAEHADQIHADWQRMIIAGTGRGAHHAVVAALQARDDGWPPLIRQLMIQPELGALVPDGSLSGLAPVTFTTLDGHTLSAGARRYADQLADAGVAVETTAARHLLASLHHNLS